MVLADGELGGRNITGTVVGMGAALSATPDLPRRWRDGRGADRQMRPVTWEDKALAPFRGLRVLPGVEVAVDHDVRAQRDEPLGVLDACFLQPVLQ